MRLVFFPFKLFELTVTVRINCHFHESFLCFVHSITFKPIVHCQCAWSAFHCSSILAHHSQLLILIFILVNIYTFFIYICFVLFLDQLQFTCKWWNLRLFTGLELQSQQFAIWLTNGFAPSLDRILLHSTNENKVICCIIKICNLFHVLPLFPLAFEPSSLAH